MNLIYDSEHLLMVAEMYHCAFERETQESERIHIKWEAIYDSLKRTQESLQESCAHGSNYFGCVEGASCGGQP